MLCYNKTWKPTKQVPVETRWSFSFRSYYRPNMVKRQRIALDTAARLRDHTGR